MLENIYQFLRPDFVQKIKSVIAELEAWGEEELFYRRWYELRNDQEALSIFFAGSDIDGLKKRKRFFLTPDDVEQN